MRRRSTRGQKRSADESADPAIKRSAARNTAIGLLARREHATAEVRRKLRDRGYDEELAVAIVDDLTRQRLLSDTRFAEAFIRSRADRGHGPVRLKAELRQLQIPAEQIEQQLRAAEVDWASLARAVRLRKFGSQAAKTMSERAKQVRFLQYRGFTAAQIRAAMDAACEDELLDAGEGEPLDIDPEM